MGIFIFGVLAVLWIVLGFLVHVLTFKMGFKRASRNNSILAAVLSGSLSVAIIFLSRAHTPVGLSEWFHQYPEKAILLTRFIEAPLAFLVSLPIFWALYREPLGKLARLALVPFAIFFII